VKYSLTCCKSLLYESKKPPQFSAIRCPICQKNHAIDRSEKPKPKVESESMIKDRLFQEEPKDDPRTVPTDGPGDLPGGSAGDGTGTPAQVQETP